MAERLAGQSVIVRYQGKGFDIADPFGRNQPFAGRRSSASGEDGRVDSYILRVGNIDEGYQGRCERNIEDRQY